jgi:hypothetical protein
VPPHRFGDPCPSGNLAGHQGLQRILFYSTGAGVCQGPSLRAQGFPVFHGCGPMSKIKPRSALALRARKPSTTNR